MKSFTQLMIRKIWTWWITNRIMEEQSINAYHDELWKWKKKKKICMQLNCGIRTQWVEDEIQKNSKLRVYEIDKSRVEQLWTHKNDCECRRTTKINNDRRWWKYWWLRCVFPLLLGFSIFLSFFLFWFQTTFCFWNKTQILLWKTIKYFN